ncbi:MAG TPA: hypothetical protein VEH54_09480, partial [Steroidobacteraceae bacterium]|nr:hypothetical protein [Steroidobacteraceae bacterium]
MAIGRLGWLSLLPLLAIGCSQHAAAPANGASPATTGLPASTSAATAGAAPARVSGGVDEGPRIVMSPDYVHIEYHLYGRGDPAVVLI